jgi:two-component system response regulator YesN
MKLYKPSRNKLFFKFLLYYSMMFLVLLLLIASLNLSYSMNVIDKKNERMYKSLIANAKLSIENRLKYLNDISVFLLNDKRFKKVLSDEELESNSIDTFEIINELKGISYTNENIESISLYAANRNTILQLYGVENSIDFLNRVYIKKFNRFEDILNHAPLWNNFYYIKPTNVFINNRNTKAMTFIKTIGRPDSTVDAGVLLVINTSWLDGILPSVRQDNQTYSFIRDTSNEIIAGENKNLDQEDHKKYFIFNEKINNVPWEIVLVAKKNSAFFIKEYLKSYVLMTGIFFLAGLLLSFLLSFSNYKPVKKIINYIENDLNRGGSYLPANDEYTMIGKYLSDTNNKTQLLKERLLAYKQIFIENHILNLVSGVQLEGNELHFLPAEGNMAEQESGYMVIEFIAGRPAGLTGLPYIIEETMVDDFITAIHRYTKSHSIHFYDLKGSSTKHILLFHFSDQRSVQLGDNPTYVHLLNVLQTNKEALEKKYNACIYMGAGTLVSNVEAIHESFKKASYVLSCAVVKGICEIAEYSWIDKDKHDLFFYPIEKEKHLIDCFNMRDMNGVQEILTDIIQENLDRRSLDLFNAKCLYYELCATLIRGMNSINTAYAGLEMEVIEKNYSLKDLPVLALLLLENIGMMEGTEKDDTLSNRIVKLIDESFCKPKLTINYIAKVLNVSSYVISKNIQIDLQDYINRKRVNYALRLLKEPKHSIKQISVMAGFSDENMFIRIFKRYEGQTPGQFRKK